MKPSCSSPPGTAEETNRDREPQTAPARMVRVYQAASAGWEQRMFPAIARRLPMAVTPDVMTCAGLVGAAMAGAGYGLSGHSTWFLWLSAAGMMLNWFGDALDGTLARVRRCERPALGFFADHVADSYSILLVFIGIGLSPYVRMDCALAAATAYLLQMVLSLIVLHVRGVFHVTVGKFGPTEARIALTLVTVAVFFTDGLCRKSMLGSCTLPDLLTLAVAVGLVATFVVRTLGELAGLRRQGGKE